MTEQETALIVDVFKRLLKHGVGFVRISDHRDSPRAAITLTVDSGCSLDPLEATVLQRLFPRVSDGTNFDGEDQRGAL